MSTDRVAEAMAAAPRSDFLPRSLRWRARHDGPLPIGHQQTSSQPRTVEAMLHLLDVGPGHAVLDVGAGSGWTTALLAHLCQPDGSVLGVERVPELAQQAAARLDRWAEQATHAPARIESARPGVLGAPDAAPYDRILVSAQAQSLPEALVGQLADGGRLVVPVLGVMLLVVRRADGHEVTRHGHYRFVPLVED